MEKIEICLGCGKPVDADCGCPAGTGWVQREPTQVKSGRELFSNDDPLPDLLTLAKLRA